ncbi:MAG: RDD family protein [Gammaproteobacteria bacterium]|nr:RDD family protein [Gammaproteobacteria bacterium]
MYVESSGLFRRLAALVYDGFLLAALWFITTGILVVINGGDALSPLVSQLVLLPALIAITVTFYTWFWTHGGQTLGMKTWKIRLVTSSGTEILPKHALLRLLSSILSIACMGAGFIWVLIDSKKCTWHDHLSQTRVVKID